MDDSRRNLEQSALRNVRSLFERLDRIDRTARRREVIAVCAIILVTASLLSLIGFAMRHPDADAIQKRQQACELDAWNAKAAEFERRMRQSDPAMPYRDIQKRLERERPFLMAAARIDCSPNSQ